MEKQSKKLVVTDTKRNFFSKILDGYLEKIISLVGIYLLLNSFFIDTESTSSSAMKYSKAGEYLLDYNVYAILFMITNIVTLILLAIQFKRYASMVQPYSYQFPVFKKYTIYSVYFFSSIAFFLIVIMNMIEFLIYQIDYEWVLLDVLIFACLLISSVFFLKLGFIVWKRRMKNIGELSVLAGFVFIIDALDYLFDFTGSGIVPNYNMTVSSIVLILEMIVVMCFSKYKTKAEQELLDNSIEFNK